MLYFTLIGCSVLLLLLLLRQTTYIPSGSYWSKCKQISTLYRLYIQIAGKETVGVFIACKSEHKSESLSLI